MPIEAGPKQIDPQEERLEKLRSMSREELDAKRTELKAAIEDKKRKAKEKDTELESMKGERERKDSGIKSKLKRLKKKQKELEDLESDPRKNPEKQIALIKQNLAKVEAKYFVELTPERKFFDPEFMRYVPGDKYMALMDSDRINSDQKEKATKARFQFCWDWLNGPEAREYYAKMKKYEEAYKRWLEDLKSDPDAPGPLDEEGNIVKRPNYDDYYNKEIRETFRNDIRTIKELSVINNYLPELFDYFDFVGHLRFPLIGEIRRSEAFSGRGRHIREVKMTDFLETIQYLEKNGVKKASSKKYFETFSPAQVKALRSRMVAAMDGKERSEVSGAGSRTWQSPITIDTMDRTYIQGFRNSDEGDKKIIVRHILIALAMNRMSKENEDALLWLRKKKEGHNFFNVNRIVEELRGELDSEQMARLERELGTTYEEAEKTK